MREKCVYEIFDRWENISLFKEWICYGCEYEFIFYFVLFIFDLCVFMDFVVMVEVKFYINLFNKFSFSN